MNTERVYRYPRQFTIIVEVLAAAAVAVALALLGRDTLRLLWAIYTIDVSLYARLPWLDDLVAIISGATATSPATFADLLPALLWAAFALLLALLLRNSMPTVRTSARGMLVEFAGDWLPVPWENVRAIKVTESGDRYVLLAETDHDRLTGWHRFYCFVYRLGLHPAFLITSQISDFNELVKTLLSETDRAARALDIRRKAELQEHASSPLFRLLLSPASFFAQRASQRDAPAPATTATGDVVSSRYPRRIGAVFVWTAAAVAVAAILRYLTLILTYLALTFPVLRGLPVFDRLDLRLLPAPWWLLLEAHIVLVLLLGVASAIYHLLPALEARHEGLAVRRLRGWTVVPWARLRAVKVTELSENSQVVLVQLAGGLPLESHLTSFLYDGSLSPGVLLTSAISNFEALLQRVVVEVMRYPPETSAPEQPPIFQSDARSDLLLLGLQSSIAIDRLVEESRADASTHAFQMGRLLQALKPAFALALLPALLIFSDRSFVQHVIPDGRIAAAALVMLLLALLEWPLVSLGVIALDEMSGGGEEGARPFYLYPLVQLPRLVPMLAALIVMLLGAQPLAVIFWLITIGWSFWLAAGLWGALYDWRGGQLLGSGLIPVVFQLMLLIGYLVVRA